MKIILKIAVLSACLGLASFLPAAELKNYFTDGALYFKNQQYARAVLFLKKAVKLDKKNWKAFQLLGDTYLQLGLNADALDAYQQSLKIQPKNKIVENIVQGLREMNEQTLTAGYQNRPAVKPAGPPRVEIMVSAGLPNYTDAVGSSIGWRDRFNLGLRVGYLLDAQLSIGGEVDYFTFSPNPPYGTTPIYGNNEMLQILSFIKYDPFNKQSAVHPYLIGGVGYMSKTIQKSYTVTAIQGYPPGYELYSLVPGSSVNACSFLMGAGIPMPLLDGMGFLIEYDQILSLGSNEAISMNDCRVGCWIDL